MSPRRRRTESSRNLNRILIAAGILLLLVGGLWFWLRPSEEPAPPPVAEEPLLPEPEDEAPRPPSPPEAPPIDLPELSASDELVRRMVQGLSSRPQLATWLATDRLIERFVRTVVDLAGGSNPAANVSFMRPDEGFAVEEIEGRLYMDPAGYARYDLLAATFASLDPEGTVQAYSQLYPLIQEAYEELGLPDEEFSTVLDRALRNLLEARPREGLLEVEPVEAVHEFVDPELESLRGAEKALLRMGPDNTRRIQAQVRELQSELARSGR
ncbi:MAG: DUF3014 domain-containing protein [Gemmatimonadales bacterium]|nr:MAG: DUF3014 domain-containing protein [Gemmatimonadales bacterium]